MPMRRDFHSNTCCVDFGRDCTIGVIVQHRLNQGARACQLRRHLHGGDDGIVHRHQAHAVVDARRPAVLFEIRALRNVGRQHARVCANANHQLILRVPADCARHIEIAGGKTGIVFADAHAVQVHDRAELRLVRP